MNHNLPNKDPIVTLKRVIRYVEKTAVTLSIVLLVGTAGYLTVHSWV